MVPLLLEELGQHGLTRRELDVIRLLAEGLSNVEIGRRLWVAPQTVKGRLASIHAKLGTRNRTEVAVWAVRSGLA